MKAPSQASSHDKLKQKRQKPAPLNTKPEPLLPQTFKLPQADVSGLNLVRRNTVAPTSRLSNNALTPTGVGGVRNGRKPGGAAGGISALVSGLKELEERMAQMESTTASIDDKVEEIDDTVETMQEKQLANQRKAENALKKIEKVADEMKDMTGGTNNMASFMDQMSKERRKTNIKLDKAVNTLDELELKVHEEGGQRGNLLQQMIKKVGLLDRNLTDLSHEV